jgi:uncharacterized protein YvpB
VSCKLCAEKLTGAVDFRCVGCCVRLLARMPNREFVGAMIRSFERCAGEGHAKEVKAAWAEFVVKRNAEKANIAANSLAGIKTILKKG